MSRTAILVGCVDLPEGDGDEHAVPAALTELGFDVSWAAWDDSRVDFAAADAVILRATWDYAPRRAEFLDWCESVPALYNPAAVARWNTDKSYLAELLDAGVAVVPTTLVEPGEPAKFPSRRTWSSRRSARVPAARPASTPERTPLLTWLPCTLTGTRP